MPTVVFAWYSEGEPEDGHHVFRNCKTSKKIDRDDLLITDARSLDGLVDKCAECQEISASKPSWMAAASGDFRIQVRY